MAGAEDPAAEVGELVLRFIASVVLHNQAVAQRVGLGVSDGQVLSLLNLNGPVSAGELARLTGLATGTVTGVVDRLERAGFVTREKDPADRRRVVVTVVPAGLATMAGHYTEQGEALRRVLERRGPEELGVIAQFLRDLVEPGVEPG